MNQLFIILYVVAIIITASANNYCSMSCDGGGSKIDHIGCIHNGQFAPICLKPQMIQLDSSLKQLLIDGHNDKRNIVAGGKLPGFSPACRMATMQWDEELASLAALNVKTCIGAHDFCHDTTRFKNSGQNIGIKFTTQPYSADGVHPFDVNERFQVIINDFFNEYKDTPQAVMDSIRATPKKTGHFTIMVNEYNTHLGCAAATYAKNDGRSYIHLTCNYARINFDNSRVYDKCQSPTCQTTTNPQFPNLCSTSEPYDLNDYHYA